MNSSSPRVVLVGCGGIARAHLGAIKPADIVALCDNNLAAAERLRTDFALDVPLFDSLENAFAASVPNIAIICTPPATHFDLARTVLEKGSHVLCEKPLALSVEQASLLLEIARREHLMLRTSAKYRFCDGVVAAKALLDSGEAGATESIRIAFGSSFDYAHSWHSNLALSGGGVWMDNGPHALDLARYFAGELHIESLQDWHYDGELDIEGCVHLQSSEDIPLELSLSWRQKLGDHFAVLHCERGVIEIGWRETLWCPHDDPVRRIAGAYEKNACFSGQWSGFLNGEARLGEEDGVHVVALIEDIYRASKACGQLCQSFG